MQVKNERTISDILAVIDRHLQQEDRAPSVGVIAAEVGVSIATVSRYVQVLISRGRVVKKGKFCALATDRSERAKADAVVCPLVGSIACGMPIFAEQNIESWVTLSAGILGSGEFFCLRARGNSMIGAGIEDGDIVVVRRQNTAVEGQIVVALVDGEDATLKRYYIDRSIGRIRLHPENETMSDMYFDSVEIQGVAVKVLKNLD